VFIDFVTLLLLNMSSGFVILALYLFRGLDHEDQGGWSLGFGMVGLIALLFGGYMSVTWPLPGPFGSIFGDLSVFFGLIFLFTGIGLARRWPLHIVAVYAIPVGLASMLTAVRIYMLNLTATPFISAVGFFFTGVAAVFALPTLTILRRILAWRVFAGAVLLLIALLWLAIGFGGMWNHAESFGKWVPLVMRTK
jgi:putative membrane protein